MNVVSTGVLIEQIDAVLTLLGLALVLFGTVMLMSRAMQVARRPGDRSGDLGRRLAPLTVLLRARSCDDGDVCRRSAGHADSMPCRAPPTSLRPVRAERLSLRETSRE